MPVDGLEIDLRPRHLYEIMDGAVERALSANPKFYAGRADQRLGVRQDEPFGNRCGSGRQFRREIFALVGVEHREAFQKGNCAGLVSIAVSPAAFLIWHEAVSILISP